MKHIQKILVLNSSSQYWGAEVSLTVFLESLEEKDFKLIIKSDGIGFEDELEKRRIQYKKLHIELSPYKLKFYQSAFKLMNLLLKNNIRIIYANNEDLSSLVAVIRILSLFYFKTKLHIRNTPQYFDFYKKLMFLHNDIICNSNYTRKTLLKDIHFYNRKKLHIVPNAHGQIKKNAILQFKNYKNYFLSVGMICERKAQLDVVKTFTENDLLESAQYLMIGKTNEKNIYQSNIEETIKKYRLEGKIFLIPFIRDLCSAYSNAIATIVPSNNETFGRVVIESGFYGTPVIVRNIEPLSELVVHKKTGLIWDGSSHHLTKLLSSLIKDNELRNTLGANLKETVMKEYTNKNYQSKLKSIISGNL